MAPLAWLGCTESPGPRKDNAVSPRRAGGAVPGQQSKGHGEGTRAGTHGGDVGQPWPWDSPCTWSSTPRPRTCSMAVPPCALCHTGLAGLSRVPGAASEPQHRAQNCSGHSPATAAAAQLGQGQGQESSSSLPGIPLGVTSTGWETQRGLEEEAVAKLVQELAACVSPCSWVTGRGSGMGDLRSFPAG